MCSTCDFNIECSIVCTKYIAGDATVLPNILQGHTAQHQHRSDNSQTPSCLFGDSNIHVVITAQSLTITSKYEIIYKISCGWTQHPQRSKSINSDVFLRLDYDGDLHI